MWGGGGGDPQTPKPQQTISVPWERVKSVRRTKKIKNILIFASFQVLFLTLPPSAGSTGLMLRGSGFHHWPLLFSPAMSFISPTALECSGEGIRSC